MTPKKVAMLRVGDYLERLDPITGLRQPYRVKRFCINPKGASSVRLTSTENPDVELTLPTDRFESPYWRSLNRRPEPLTEVRL